MEIPDEFVQFTGKFWSGSDQEVTSQSEWVLKAAKKLTPEQRAVCKRYVKYLLDKNASDAEFKAAWKSGMNSYGIREGRFRAVFEEICNLL